MKIFTIIIIAILFLTRAGCTSANFYVTESSARLRTSSQLNYSNDQRINTLKNYLEYHRSPLTEYSDYIIEISDKYDLDWRLIPAISGVESTFGKNIPANSYNAYGWNNGNFKFESWEDSIDRVARTLREKYIDKGYVNLTSIGNMYAPPSRTWAWNVKYFMNEIEPFPLVYSL